MVTVSEDELTTAVGEFLAAYVTAAGEVDRYLTPGVRLTAVSPAPFSTVIVRQISALEEAAAEAARPPPPSRAPPDRDPPRTRPRLARPGDKNATELIAATPVQTVLVAQPRPRGPRRAGPVLPDPDPPRAVPGRRLLAGQ
ncbi:hypothetical protein [Streptomyces justiciae]|uniref:hypothetical protein n=1 Tax=Streptomyces justiciae TaxID=2780140 RepID=UPI002118A015|nr:hypothetical protein [Streptomyces justiciae]MCW8382641.1 hypothetical protein [Streptomyces justiciae]